MIRSYRLGVWLTVSGLIWLAAPSMHAQTVQRDTRVTGPRGRTIDRQVDIQRGPGGYSRQLQIQRPGGTLERSTTIQRGWGGFPGGGFGFRPLPFFAPRPINSWGFGIAAAPIITIPFFGGGFGGGYAGGGVAPGMVPGVAGYAQPGAMAGGQPAPAGQPNPLDPVVLAGQKLQSFHASSRRDGARELGQLGDPRGIPPLIHVLKYDSSRDVRVAAATSLGELGGNESEVVLERCIIYEKKQEVRDAAAAALRSLRDRRAALSQNSQPAQSWARSRATTDGNGAPQAEVPRIAPTLPPVDPRPSPFQSQAGAQQPALDAPAMEAPPASEGERVPPPPPSPVRPE